MTEPRSSGRWSRPTLAVATGVLGALFVALGIWQLERHRERQEENAWRAERRAAPPIELRGGGPLPPAQSLAWRRIRVAGRYDLGREVVLANRSLNGIAGVYLLTPLRTGDSLAIPVLRGWLPAPDGVDAPLEAGWPEGYGGAGGAGTAGKAGRRRAELAGPAVEIAALALPYPEPGSRTRSAVLDSLAAPDGLHPVLRALDREALDRLLPLPLPDFYLYALVPPGAKGARREGALPRPPPAPELESGPHLAYAFQWFAFAAIAVVGGGILLFRGPAGGD